MGILQAKSIQMKVISQKILLSSLTYAQHTESKAVSTQGLRKKAKKKARKCLLTQQPPPPPAFGAWIWSLSTDLLFREGGRCKRSP